MSQENIKESDVLSIQIDSLKHNVQKQSDEIQILKQNIKYRDITIHFYKNLIQSKLGIKISNDIFEEDIILYSNLTTKYKGKKEKKLVSKNKGKIINSKKTISKAKVLVKKKIPSSIQFTKEKTLKEIQDMITEIDTKLIKENTSPSDKLWILKFNEHEECIEKLLKSLESARSYGKYLSEIKYHRLHFLKFLDEENCKKYMEKYTEKIKDIFRNRGCDEKKIKNLVKHKIISAYEHRMLMLDDFEKTNIDIDEMNLVKKCFEHKIKYKKIFEVFSNDILTQNICNYQLCISNILTVISNVVTNIYGFNNIIYLSFDDNHFAFYYLENILKNKRNWIMDCQLDDISNEIRIKSLNYCICIFRKIYQKIFHDNQYRSDFLDISQVMELEGIQILKNMIYLNNKKQFVSDFQNIIKTCNKYEPTEIDNFNLFTDDPLLKIEYKNRTIHEQFKDIFDNITKKQSNDLYFFIQKQK